MTPEVSIVIVSYNTREMTLACLDSIVAETRGLPYEIIVVDNASSDGSPAAIAAHPARPRLLALDTNAGFARANNIASQVATGKYLLLLNPDTLVRDEAIEKLVAFAARHPDARIWGGRTLFADGRLNPSSAWGRMTLWRLACRALGLTGLAPKSSLFNGEAIGGWDRATERQVDIVSGCFFLLESRFWRQLGGFDETFFMYGEEADLCLRARRLGARPLATPAATIVHYGGASEATRENKMVKLLAAKATLIQRHFPAATRRAAVALHAAWPLSRWLALAGASRLLASSTFAGRADVWRRIWQRRSEWASGWDERHQTNRPTAAAPAGTLSATRLAR